jgi:hypothetical protein
MALSSVFVLGNALRLKGFRPPMAAETSASDQRGGMEGDGVAPQPVAR